MQFWWHSWHKAKTLLFEQRFTFIGVTLAILVLQAIVFFATDPQPQMQVNVGVAAIWLSLMFTGLWLIEELLRDEWQHAAYEIYVVAQREDYFFWFWWLFAQIILFVLAIIAWFIAALFFQISVVSHLGFISCSSFLFAFSASSLMILVRLVAQTIHQQGYIATLLLFPLLVPLLLSVIQASHLVMIENSDPTRWMLLAGFFGMLYTLLGSWVVASAMRQ